MAQFVPFGGFPVPLLVLRQRVHVGSPPPPPNTKDSTCRNNENHALDGTSLEWGLHPTGAGHGTPALPGVPRILSRVLCVCFMSATHKLSYTPTDAHLRTTRRGAHGLKEQGTACAHLTCLRVLWVLTVPPPQDTEGNGKKQEGRLQFLFPCRCSVLFECLESIESLPQDPDLP